MPQLHCNCCETENKVHVWSAQGSLKHILLLLLSVCLVVGPNRVKESVIATFDLVAFSELKQEPTQLRIRTMFYKHEATLKNCRAEEHHVLKRKTVE